MHGPHYETSRWCAVVACSSSGVLVECERGIERSSSGGTQQQQRWSFVLFLACSGGGGGGGCCGGVVAAVVVFCVWWCCGKEVVVIMSFCVPHWDSRGVTREDGMPSNEYLELEGKGDITRYKRNQLSHFATVPDQYTVESPWTTDGHVDMQGQNNKGNKSQWQTTYNSNWNNGQETEDGVTPSKPPTLKDSTLEAVVSAPPSEAPSAPVTNAQDDEMVSWLQYPLDDTLEKTYCSDFFGELRKSDMPLQGISDSFSGGHARAQRMPHHGSAGNDTVVNRNASAETAMLMGVGRAVGLLPQNGAEAFSKVRTLQPAQQPNPSKSWQFHNSMAAQGLSSRSTTSRIGPNNMLPPKSQPISDGHLSGHPSRVGTMNFSHFSRPAALVNANLHSLALNSTPPPAARIKPQLGKPVVEASASSGSSIAESTTTGRSKMESQRDAQVQIGSTETEHQNGVGDSRCPVHPSSVSRKETRGVSEEGLMKSTSKPVDQDACHLSSVTGSALPNSSEKAGSQRTQLPDAQEPTITSSSGGSGTSAQRAKEAATSTKRKSRENEDADCHSEEGEEESVDLKKQQQPAPGRGSTAKRSRAAEVHNLSERRRRDRINEKMKALQELIPNSNKTDKASMLDEAIEYLKMLQLQLQMMSMRSGMSLPPMVMPQAMQPMQMSQMSQMTAIPQMAMGMMGMQGMIGMSMMDLGQPAQGRPVAPMLSHGGPSHDGSVSSSLNPADGHDPRLHTSSAMETINACLPHQHQSMQMPPAMNLEMYNAYVLQQHQHQHHHHHHQTPNMGWGPPQ